tara:strand:+ start:2232 stop:2708 length:477 start_codon:yes stop_codon:yes gene_type:complete
MINNLIKLANHLDRKGYTKESNYLDGIISKLAKDSEDRDWSDDTELATEYVEPEDLEKLIKKTMTKGTKDWGYEEEGCGGLKFEVTAQPLLMYRVKINGKCKTKGALPLTDLFEDEESHAEDMLSEALSGLNLTVGKVEKKGKSLQVLVRSKRQPPSY